MNILLISDVECPALWDYYQPERVAEVTINLFRLPPSGGFFRG